MFLVIKEENFWKKGRFWEMILRIIGVFKAGLFKIQNPKYLFDIIIDNMCENYIFN